MAPIFLIAATQLLLLVNAGLPHWNSSNQPGRGDLQQQHLHLGAAGERTSLISLARSTAGSLQRKRAAKQGKAAEMPAQAAGAETAERTEFDVEQRLEGLDYEAAKIRTALKAVSSQDLGNFGISRAGFQNLTVTMNKMAAELFMDFDKDKDGQILGPEVRNVQTSMVGRGRLLKTLTEQYVFPPMFTIHEVMASLVSLVTRVDKTSAQLMMTFKDYIALCAYFGINYKRFAPQEGNASMLPLGAVYSPRSHSRAEEPCEQASLLATVATARVLLAILGIPVENGEEHLISTINENAGVLETALAVARDVHTVQTLSEALPFLTGFFHKIYDSGVLIFFFRRMFTQMSYWDWSVMLVTVASNIFTIFPIDGGISMGLENASIAESVPDLPGKFQAVYANCL